MALTHDGTNLKQVTYGYDAETRFSTIEHVDASVEYAYNGNYMTGCTIALSNGLTFTRTFVRDPHRKHLINTVSNCFEGVSVQSTIYAHDLLSRRTNIVMTAQAGTNTLACAYNPRSEITGVTIDTNAYTYIYDNIGNSLFTSLNAVTNSYTVNNLNLYKAVTNLLDLSGYRLLHDSDGNTTRIGGHALLYDAENRLSFYTFGLDAYEPGTVRNAYVYDHLGRRVKKTELECRVYDPGGMVPPTYWWQTNVVTTFVYDGWNLIREAIAYTNGTSDSIEYVWGLDLSGTMQGAGGVGGLLFEKRNGNIFIPCYDANGNITAYIDTNGTVRARYVYDAFAKTIVQSGDMADLFRFRFSTKYYDEDTGLYYYGYRYYSPMLQRWFNRDPIEESGGVNLYLACYNNFITFVDNVGLDASFYAKGKHETLFHLAADEQAVTIRLQTIEDALKLKNHSDNWGPIYKGSKPVKEFTLSALLEESGEVHVYAHGTPRRVGFNERGGDSTSLVDATRLSSELAKRACWHNLTKLWIFACRLGSRGGAQEVANVLKIPVIAKEKGDVNYMVLPYVDFTSSMKRFWKGSARINIINEFINLGEAARTEPHATSYEKFRSDWKTLTDKYIKQGCIKGAYWHVWATEDDFIPYEPE